MRFLPALLLVLAVPLTATAQFAPPTVEQSIAAMRGDDIAANGSGMEVFVAQAEANRVAVMSQDQRITYVAVGRAPRYIASGGFRFFTSNEDGTISYRTADAEAATFPIGGWGPIRLADADTAAVLFRDGRVGIVNVIARSVRVVDTGSSTVADFAVDLSRQRLYVSDPVAREIRVVDLGSASERPPHERIAMPGRPGPVGFNGTKLYVLTDDGTTPIVELDVLTRQPRLIAFPGHGGTPSALHVGVGTVFAGFDRELVMMDVTSHNLRSFPDIPGAKSITFDSIGGQGFALTSSGSLAVIDPSTLKYWLLPVGSANEVTFIYKLCKAYVVGSSALTVVHAPCGDLGPEPTNGQGIWWVADGAESGWGINITHQGDKLFATWFTYDDQGRPAWFVMSDGARSGRYSYSGALYVTTGPWFAAPAFDPASVARTQVGTMQFDVFNVDHAQMTAVVNGRTVNKLLVRQQFASPLPRCGPDVSPGASPNYTALWWAAPAGSESGWGLNLVHQGDVIFATWFTYDSGGRGTWFVGSSLARSGSMTFTGTMFTTAGPPYSAAPWDASRVSRMPSGNATLTFTDQANGTFDFSLGGVNVSKRITRQVFASPQAVCR
jgi:hypothetical protein